MYRNRLNADDEAKFALLEPDGVSPMKARARQSAESKRNMYIALAIGVPFMLFLMRPSPGVSTTWTAASSVS